MQVVTNPSVLPRILSQLIDSETLTPGSISADKLGFRLRLIGGAVREATGEVLLQCIEQVYVLTGVVYTQHSEKSVRKAANKLVKVIIIFFILWYKYTDIYYYTYYYIMHPCFMV